MNAIFTVILISSMLVITISAPQELLPALLGGAEKSLKTAFVLFSVYAVWMGLSALAEKSGLSKGAAKLLKPAASKFFKTKDETALENITMNISCNLLGIGGAATPFAVKAIGALEKENNEYAQKLLFVINATSIQLIPSTVIALRTQAGSASAFDIFLPSLICTAVSTVAAVLIFIVGKKLWR